jgi:hypothetical protein
MVFNLFGGADEFDVALVEFLSGFMKVFECLGHEFFYEFAKLRGLAAGVLEDLHFLILQPFCEGRGNLKVIEAIHDKVLVMVNQ